MTITFPFDFLVKSVLNFFIAQMAKMKTLALAFLILLIGAGWKPPGRVITEVDGAEMVLVPEGIFLQGEDYAFSDEVPMREVFISAFYIDLTEVTYERYKKYIDSRGVEPPPDCGFSGPRWNGKEFYPEWANHPVTCITWLEARDFCDWAGKRLPTEAEWEKAARGTKGRIWPWGDKWDKEKLNSGSKQTLPVGNFPKGKSPFGALDMAGNAFEWVNDYYNEAYYPTAPDRNPQGPSTGEDRVLKGGSFASEQILTRCSYRSHLKPDVRKIYNGFRCAQGLKAP